MPLIFGGRWAVPQKPRVFLAPGSHDRSRMFFQIPMTNYQRKTIGKWWFYGGLMVFQWDFPSGKRLHDNGKSHVI